MRRAILGSLAFLVAVSGALYYSGRASDVGGDLDIGENHLSSYSSFEGEVTHVDEDFLAVWASDGRMVSYQFENVRITNKSGETRKLVSPGPTNYVLGDNVRVRYDSDNQVTSEEILERGAKHRTQRTSSRWIALQEFVLDADGIIISSEFAKD